MAPPPGLAEFLRGHPRVARVNYPGLGASEVAERQMRGFGGMLSFVYDGDALQTAAVVDKLAVFSIVASLGGVESLVTQPITTTHHGCGGPPAGPLWLTTPPRNAARTPPAPGWTVPFLDARTASMT